MAVIAILSIFLLSSCLQVTTNPTTTGVELETISAATAPDIEKQEQPYFKTMNLGSSKVFEGKCLFVNIFLSDSVSFFNNAEKQNRMRKMVTVKNYFEQRSKPYNKRLSFIYNEDNLTIDYKTDFVIPDNVKDNMWTYYLLVNILSEYDVESVVNQYEADNISFLFHINKTGRSYAMVQNEGFDSFYDNEIGVLYSSVTDTNSNIVETGEFTYAHEILHLFGAIDLYYPYNPEDERIALAEEYFPDDIMLRYFYEIDQAEIGEVAAYLIGWSRYLETEYCAFVQ